LRGTIRIHGFFLF